MEEHVRKSPVRSPIERNLYRHESKFPQRVSLRRFERTVSLAMAQAHGKLFQGETKMLPNELKEENQLPCVLTAFLRHSVNIVFTAKI